MNLAIVLTKTIIMKSINLILTSLFLGIVFCSNGQSQNSNWSLPPYNVDVSATFVTNLPTTYTANNASNMQLDANGDILFYIVDNEVRDVDGDLIGDFRQFYESANWLPYMCMGLAYTSEILIIQDPNNCNRYYIVSSAGTTRACNDGPPVSPYPNVTDPFMAVIDFGLIRPNNPNKTGAISSVEFLEDLNSVPPSLSWRGTDLGGILLAASKLQTTSTDKYRYVFVSYYSANPQDPNGILRFKIGNNGMEYDGLIPFQVQNADGGSRAEMELIELSNGQFRIACPYGSIYSSHAGKNLTASIFIADLDATGNTISGSEKTLYFYRNSGFYEGPFIHGLEFSPDGSKLFITHDASFYHDQPFEYYDFNSFNNSDPNGNGIYSLNISSSTVEKVDFQNSQIELATDGKIYLGAQGRLASLSNPNNPSVNNFTDNVVILPNYQANYGADNTTNIMNLNKSYTLPDQIDGMNYENFAPTVYTETSYTAQGTGVWSPGSSNNPWGVVGDVFIENELIIPSGKNVTIQNMTFRFGPDAKVIIEQGAKLTIDGTTFTNSRPCNNEEQYWQGVRVYGTTNQHQFPSNNPTYQGMLELKNGATIEYANKAAVNWNEDSWDEIGGVIKSTNGIFRNNRWSVAFMAYENFHPTNSGITRDNTSSFTDTEFFSDDDFIEGNPRQPHVTMWKVRGINFRNCHFANNVTTNKSLSSSANDGIIALDASFKVIPRCDSPILPVGTPCPTNLLLRSSFTGLEHAIQIAGAGISEAVTVSQSDFSKNVWGIYVDEFDNVNLNRNDFVLGYGGYSNSIYFGNGITLDNSTGFIVEENTVLSTLNGGKTSGIVVNNSGEADNEVYKNTLTNLLYGTHANKINRKSDLHLHTGLQFLCNDYVDNNWAISVNYGLEYNGIRYYQGEFNPRRSAGNTFSNNIKDIVNNSGSHFNYYHSGGNSEPNIATGPVEVISEAVVNTCPTNFTNGVIIMHEVAMKLAGFEADLTNSEASYNNLMYNYISLIDNGNTELFQGQIMNEWSDDAWHLRNNLMQESPFLSSEAILTAAGENILPNAMLLEVLLANPDATRGEGFINKLNEVTGNALPEYMLNYVRNNWDTETVRTTLEGEIMSYQAKIATATHFIKYLQKSKDESTYSEGLNTALMGEGVSNKYGLIDFFIENNDWFRADSVLQALNNDSDLEGDLGLLEDLDEYLTFRTSLGDRNIAQLDATEVQYLETLAEKGSRASGYAENILCFFYDICFEKEMLEGGSMAKMLTIPTPSGDEPSLEELMYNITVYPNPANEFTSIKWEIYDELENAQYKIFDINGREMGLGSIEENTGEKVIDTRSLENGVYIINIYNEGVMKFNSKLIVSNEK